MNIEKFRKYCLTIKGSEESISLQNRNVLVCKVMGKVLFTFLWNPKRVYLKPTLNAIRIGRLNSVDEVIKKLSKKQREEYLSMFFTSFRLSLVFCYKVNQKLSVAY